MKNKTRKLVIAFIVLLVGALIYIRTHPLVFNESFFQHAHCIAQAGRTIAMYAQDHHGMYPSHTNGYGDALLMLVSDPIESSALTGPGYDKQVFDDALGNHTDVPESECGRVYVQELGANSNPELVVLFDKLPSPGGDHCHLLKRLFAPLGREVLFVGGGHRFVKESDWPTFAQRQIDLLVKEGIPKETAESLYSEKPK